MESKEGKKYNFKKGDWIVPGGSWQNLFIYDGKRELYEGAEYRLATENEKLFYIKHVKMMSDMESMPSLEKYKESNDNIINSEVEAEDSIRNEYLQKMELHKSIFGRR